jgi:hypothetical protein
VDNLIQYCEIIATVLIIIAVPLVSIPKRLGLWFMFFGQIFWSIFGYYKGNYYFFFQSLFLFFTNIYGLYSWRKKGIK